MRTAAFAFLISLVLSACLTPLVRQLALRFGWLDLGLEARKIHGRPIPRIGGIAIILAFYAPMLGMLAYPTSLSEIFYGEPTRAAALLGGGLCIGLLGFYDDLRGASAWTKLTVQLGVAVVLWAAGIRIERFSIPGVGTLELDLLSLPVSAMWVTGIINAMNLIDGLDGLAGGVALLALGTSIAFSFVRGDATMALLSASLAGGVLGFLVYNFNPASIFMGDSGSMFLGFILAAGAMVTTTKSSTVVAILVPLLSLGVPLTDTLLAITRRALAGRPIFSADRDHIHHRLLALGLSQKQAVLVLYGVTALLGSGALALSFINSWQMALVLTAAAGGAAFAVRQLYGLTKPHASADAPATRLRLGALAAARGLRTAADAEQALRALAPLGAALGGARLQLRLPGREPLDTGLESGAPAPFPPPTLTFPLGEKGELGALDLFLPGSSRALGREAEVALEAICLLLATCLEEDRQRA